MYNINSNWAYSSDSRLPILKSSPIILNIIWFHLQSNARKPVFNTTQKFNNMLHFLHLIEDESK